LSCPESIKATFVGIAVLAGLAVACSSGDDAPADTAPARLTASAGTAVAAGPTAVAEDGAASELEEEYTLAQQFELSINVTSSKFNEKRRIPRKYSCTEEDISPPISWSDVPEGTVSMGLVVDSDQFPGPPWAHWVLWGIPPDARGLSEAVPNTSEAPSIGPKARQGTNNEDKVGWSGPCPPPVRYADGSAGYKVLTPPVKQYLFRLYALDTDIELGADATKEDLLRAMDGHVLAGGELVGEHVSKTRLSAP
jgi:hypothetical protein